MNIVFPDSIDLDQAAIGALKKMGVHMYDDTPSDQQVIAERIRDAEIVTANFIDLKREAMEGATRLKYIIVPAVGYEWVDYAYAAARGIKVLNCPTQNAEAVAEHALALIMAAAHRLVEAQTDLEAGGWGQQRFMGTEVSHKRLGLVGHGKIGKYIEQKVSGLDMQVCHVNSKSSADEVDELLRDSDVVVLCLPLTDATRGLIDKRRVALLKPGAILVNVARGALVDQTALLAALKSGAIRGAGLDVFENEPFTGGAPKHIVEFAKLPNVVATPHMAYNTEETMTRLGEELIANLESCLRGEPINVVNS